MLDTLRAKALLVSKMKFDFFLLKYKTIFVCKLKWNLFINFKQICFTRFEGIYLQIGREKMINEKSKKKNAKKKKGNIVIKNKEKKKEKKEKT